MQRLLFALSLVASAAVGALAAEDLKIDVTTEVECDRKTQKGDTIEVHYRGTLASNGNKFDASYDRGTPFSFKLGVGQVIKGWDIGMEGACIGEKRTLTVPPELGYGNRGMGPIPAGSTLIFETEIIGIKGVPKPETIITKSSSSTSSAASAASEVAEDATDKVADKATEKASSASAGIAEKVASAASVAADVAATVIVDSDDSEDHHEEL